LAGRHIGIPVEIECGASDLPYADWHEIAIPLPEASHEPYLQLYFRQNRKIAQHARVAFAGYGGDGVMTGQSWPYLSYLLRRFRLGKICKAFGGYAVNRGKLPPLRGGFRSTVLKWFRRLAPKDHYPCWMAPEFEREVQLFARWHELRQSPAGVHPWYPIAHALLTSDYWPAVLENEDAAKTGQAIEMRSPFLDLRVQRFLLRVPPVPLCIDKELLRCATRGMLPEQIRCRPKTPFGGDQVMLQMQKGLWKPLPIRKPPNAIRNFVDWPSVAKTLETEPVLFPWSALRPVSLSYWMERIESE
jgi:asparagine synthase (glutamine-hydrolysing)